MPFLEGYVQENKLSNRPSGGQNVYRNQAVQGINSASVANDRASDPVYKSYYTVDPASGQVGDGSAYMLTGSASAQNVANAVEKNIDLFREQGLIGLHQKLVNNTLPIIFGKGTDLTNLSESIEKAFGDGISSFGLSYNGSSGVGSVHGASPDAVLQHNDMQDYINMINQTADKNNAWSAEQAQKQMDFQERMSNTAHQREVKDLIAAGLNPILSASGGSGAASLNGAMATPDTSNTRLLAELSLESLSAIGNSAVAVAQGYSSKASNSFKNSLLNAATKYFVPALAKGAANAFVKGLF